MSYTAIYHIDHFCEVYKNLSKFIEIVCITNLDRLKYHGQIILYKKEMSNVMDRQMNVKTAG